MNTQSSIYKKNFHAYYSLFDIPFLQQPNDVTIQAFG